MTQALLVSSVFHIVNFKPTSTDELLKVLRPPICWPKLGTKHQHLESESIRDDALASLSIDFHVLPSANITNEIDRTSSCEHINTFPRSLKS